MTSNVAQPQANGAWLTYGLAIIAGMALGGTGALLANTWAPGITASLTGAEPKAYWYVSHASGFVSYGLLCVSMALGLLLTGRVAKLWPGGPTAVDLHEFTTLTALVMAAVHALILLGDKYIAFSPLTLLVPMLSPYRAEWVMLGQVGFYLAVPIILSFYLRRFLGPRTWRTLHYLTFAVFTLVTAHGVWAGSDSTNSFVLGSYVFALVSLYGLTVYRILAAVRKPKGAEVRTAA